VIDPLQSSFPFAAMIPSVEVKESDGSMWTPLPSAALWFIVKVT